MNSWILPLHWTRKLPVSSSYVTGKRDSPKIKWGHLKLTKGYTILDNNRWKLPSSFLFLYFHCNISSFMLGQFWHWPMNIYCRRYPQLNHCQVRFDTLSSRKRIDPKLCFWGAHYCPYIYSKTRSRMLMDPDYLSLLEHHHQF